MYKRKTVEGKYPRISVTDKFVKDNNFELKVTNEDIKQKIKESQDDIFDFSTEVLIDYLPWDEAKNYITEDYIKAVESGKIDKPEVITDVKEAAQDFLDYMVFAWGKALDERGISAGRSIQKLGTWLWLMDRKDLEELIHRDDLYNPYGAPALIKVCEELSINCPKELKDFASVEI